MPLSVDLLDRLERCWRDQDVPWLSAVRPGLSPDELDAVAESFGHPLPEEVRLWWGWHDAIEGQPWIMQGLEWISASGAVRVARTNLDVSEEVAAADDVRPAEDIWPASWLSLFGTGSDPSYCVDCEERAGPIYFHDFWGSFDGKATAKIAASSLGDVIHRLCEAYDAGLQRWDHGLGDWVRARPSQERLGLTF